MTGHVTWSDEYSLGYSPIDEQHKQLLNLLDMLYAAEKADEPLSNVSDVLFRLVVFTETHFAYEEMLLELVGFPKLRKHSLYHEIMKSKTRDIVQDFRKSHSFDREEVLIFLLDWWTNHILEEDMQYRPFLADHGLLTQAAG